MEKTIIQDAGGHPHEYEVPTIRIFKPFNETALEYLTKRTGIEFVERENVFEGKPETWEQFSKVFLVYDFLTHRVTCGGENLVICRCACSAP